MRVGDWKLYRRTDADGATMTVELFNLANDPGESTDRAAESPDIVAELIERAAAERAPSEPFPSPFDPEN